MNDVEQMAFLNNVMDYKEFGGKSISSSRRTAGPELVEDSFSYTNESRDTVKSLREEMKIAYRKSFDKLTGDETADELKDMLKNLDIDGVPFAQGGRASFAGGKIIDEIILMLTKKEPMEAMKEVNKIIGCIHAGWKGAVNGIIENTLNEILKLNKKNKINVAIGPCIHTDKYEVGQEFYLNFINASKKNDIFFFPSKKNKFFFDLRMYVNSKFNKFKINHVENINFDTFSDSKNFFSFRRSGQLGEKDYGRCISVISLIND